MGKYIKHIIDLEGLPDYKYIQFLRVEILNIQGFNSSFFGRVRYARNGIEQDEGLPMDLSKGIFIATLRDDQLNGIPRDELEKTLQDAADDITKIVRYNLPLDNLYHNHNHWDENEKQVGKDIDKKTIEILNKILTEYPYLTYDEDHSEPPDILRCRVKNDSTDSPRHANDIFQIVEKLKTETGQPYSIGTYGGSFNGDDDLDKVWTRFSLRKFNFEDKAKNN